MDIGAELKGKAGPFPLYVWLLILTGIAIIYFVFAKKKKGASSGTPGTPCTLADGSAGTWDSSGSVCVATTVSTVNMPDNSQPPSASPTPDTTGAGAPVPPVPVTTPGSTVPPGQWPAGQWPGVQPAHKVMVPVTAGLPAGEAHNLLVQAGFVPKAPSGQTPNMKVSHTVPSQGTFQSPGIPVWIYTAGYVNTSSSGKKTTAKAR